MAGNREILYVFAVVFMASQSPFVEAPLRSGLALGVNGPGLLARHAQTPQGSADAVRAEGFNDNLDSGRRKTRAVTRSSPNVL